VEPSVLPVLGLQPRLAEEEVNMPRKLTQRFPQPEVTGTPSIEPYREVTLDLDEATIQRLEAEKKALLASLHLPERREGASDTGAVIAVAPDPVVEEQPVEPVSDEELAAARSSIETLKVQHDETTKTRELEFQSRMSAAMETLGQLERRQAKALDQQAAARLREAVKSMSESPVPGEVRATRLSLGEERKERLKRRVQPVLAQAGEVKRQLAAWEAGFGPALAEVREKTYDDLTLGASNPAVASTLWHGIQRTLVDIEDLRSALYATLGDEIRVDPQEGVTAGHIRVIAQLVESSIRVFGQDEEIKLTHALHRLATATPDSITTLQNLAKGVTGALQRLRELTEARNAEEPVLQPRRLPEPYTVDEKMRAGVLPTRANADYSPFGQGS
jgi:hypothetical protein